MSNIKKGFYICKNINKPKPTDGTLYRPTKEDIELLSDYWYYAHLEMEGVTPITKEISTENVERLLSSNKIYCWKNKDNIIVSIGYYKIISNKAEICGVYTNPKYRRNNYASNLVYNITKELINKNFEPILYTNYNYEPSNKTYVNIGYELIEVIE